MTRFKNAYQLAYKSADVLAGLANTANELGDNEDTRNYYTQLQDVNPKAAERYTYITGESSVPAGRRKPVVSRMCSGVRKSRGT